MGGWSVAWLDGPSCLLKQAPGSEADLLSHGVQPLVRLFYTSEGTLRGPGVSEFLV